MSNSYNYLPVPPRVWSRVQNQCTYTDASGNSDINYNDVYIPLTQQTVSQGQANYETRLFYKGNILQYKGNSSQLTKNQKYSQLAKGLGPNRTKVFATQGQTYTNPNTSGLQRINYTTYQYPNPLVGAPNNPSGPFQYNVQSPFDCSTNLIQDGGTLVCGTYANQCTGQVIQKNNKSATICNLSSCSDVPGRPINLCWNNNLQTFFPRQRYFMNNSGTKWPEGYKGFVSATKPSAPVLTLNSYTSTSATISWTYLSKNCFPISNYAIYQNGILVQKVLYTTTSTTINGLTCYNSFYVTSVSNTTESQPSNIVSVLNIASSPSISLIGQNQSIVVNWDQLSSDCSIDYYNVYYSTDNSNFTTINTGNVSTYTISNLTNGTTYYIYVSAVNTVGESNKSETKTAIPNTVPDAPTSLTLTFSGTTINSS
jgi:hypothetical protein